MLFFHAPNHRITSFRSLARASRSSASTEVQSNFPSTGSMSSQDTGASTVFKCIRRSRGQCGAMYEALEALELPSSPPSTRNGLSCTIKRVAEPCFSSRGGAAFDWSEVM